MPARILEVAVTDGVASPEGSLDEAARVLSEGGVVAFPTETVYGLGARADDPAAVARLTGAKDRDPKKPLAYQAASPLAAIGITERIPPRALPLLRRFWPGPLTLVVPAAGGGTKGLRVPAHAVAQGLLERVEAPVFGTSANFAGEPPLTDAAAVRDALGDRVDLILDAGPSALGQSSTVVKVTDTGFTVLREGIISADDVRRRLTTRIVFVCTGNSCRSPMAEAMFKKRLSDVLRIPIGMLDAHGFEVRSAGTSAGRGAPAAAEGAEVMRERGLDLSRHQSRPTDHDLVDKATLLVTMSASHRFALIERWPDIRDKVCLLDEDGVPDPIGASVEVYRACAEQIDERLSWLVEWLFGDALGRAVLGKLPAAVTG